MKGSYGRYRFTCQDKITLTAKTQEKINMKYLFIIILKILILNHIYSLISIKHLCKMFTPKETSHYTNLQSNSHFLNPLNKMKINSIIINLMNNIHVKILLIYLQHKSDKLNKWCTFDNLTVFNSNERWPARNNTWNTFLHLFPFENATHQAAEVLHMTWLHIYRHASHLSC